MSDPDGIGIGLLGLGVVGGGVARALTQKADTLAQQVGCPICIRGVVVRDAAKPRDLPLPQQVFYTRYQDLLSRPDVHIIVELIGGEHPALEIIKEALSRGKHVVTANKEVMAKHGPELISLANAQGVSLFFEASVGGGIPLIGPLLKDLLANEIWSIHAIINGTTNYILTRMSREGIDFAEALEEAQSLGYAEADPSNDVDGVDAAYKLAILATLAFRIRVRAKDVYYEGISRLGARDFRYAQELGYAIKLLAIAQRQGDAVQLRVHPAFIPQDYLLAKVDGVFNAVEIEGDLVGRVAFHGQGAGSLPTSSAVVADILEIARSMASGRRAMPILKLNGDLIVMPVEQVKTRYYLRMTVVDRPGVLAKIAQVLGDLNISIASVIQKEVNLTSGTAEIVIMTHPAMEASIREALDRVDKMQVVEEVGNFVRVEHWAS